MALTPLLIPQKHHRISQCHLGELDNHGDDEDEGADAEGDQGEVPGQIDFAGVVGEPFGKIVTDAQIVLQILN